MMEQLLKFYHAFTLVADVLILVVGLQVVNESKALPKCGYQMQGFEVMYNGHAGQRLSAHIFLGPTYYQRLKHVVDHKIHS